ncbi:MAG: response regulator [Betaproteobacteria bacterium]
MDILLVEDEPHDVEMTLRALRKYHLSNKIHVARDGEDALAFILGTALHAHRTMAQDLGLIILDLMLPKMSGFEILQALQQEPKVSHIPVVVLTDSKESPNVVESYRLGAKSYMVKPVDFAKLVHTVKELGFEWSLSNPTVPAD